MIRRQILNFQCKMFHVTKFLHRTQNLSVVLLNSVINKMVKI